MMPSLIVLKAAETADPPDIESNTLVTFARFFGNTNALDPFEVVPMNGPMLGDELGSTLGIWLGVSVVSCLSVGPMLGCSLG